MPEQHTGGLVSEKSCDFAHAVGRVKNGKKFPDFNKLDQGHILVWKCLMASLAAAAVVVYSIMRCKGCRRVSRICIALALGTRVLLLVVMGSNYTELFKTAAWVQNA